MMNKHKIEKMIKHDVTRHTPDILDRIDLDTITIEPARKRKHYLPFLSRFRKVSYLLGALAVFVILFTLWPENSVITPPNPNQQPSTLLKEKDNMIGFSAMSSVIAMNDLTSTNTSLNNQPFTYLSTVKTQNAYNLLSDIEMLENYLPIVNSFLGDEQNFNVDVTESDLPAYTYKMSISVVDITGETLNYDFYYNELIDDNGDQDQDDYESTIEGIILIDGNTYTLVGEREVEAGEESFELTATFENNHVIIEYNSELDNQESAVEYLYELYKNDELVKSIEIEFEEDNDESTIEMYFIEGIHESYFSFEVTIEDGIRIIEIEFEISEDGDVIDEGTIEADIRFDETKETYVITYRVIRDDEEDEVFEDEDYDDEEDEEDEEDEL